jgi:hypothetical protein
MRDEHHRNALSMVLLKDGQHLIATFSKQVAGRFVCQQDRWFGDNRPSNRHTLLPTRKLRRGRIRSSSPTASKYALACSRRAFAAIPA